jgi:GxxExxY protein
MNNTESLELLSDKIADCATRVHNHFGPGFPERTYFDALCAELKKDKIKYRTEETIVSYVNGAQIGTKRCEIIVEEIMIELKALPRIEIPHVVLFSNELKKLDLELGMLINFGTQKLQVKKRVNKNAEIGEE